MARSRKKRAPKVQATNYWTGEGQAEVREAAAIPKKRTKQQPTTRAAVAFPDFEQNKRTLEEAIAHTIQSLKEYCSRYKHICISFSGGKDSSTVVSLYFWLLSTGQIPTPETVSVFYADTRQELPPLHAAAMEMLNSLEKLGVNVQIVLPELDKRYFVYMFGRGVPPPNNRRMRWCTGQIKVLPMIAALQSLRDRVGEKILMLTGVRIGESDVRDDRIQLSCNRDNTECGQGWLQVSAPHAVADTLAPILEWRVCHVWDWLSFFAPQYGFKAAALVADVYGGEEAEELNARTGCVGCPLAEKETALDHLVKKPLWAYLAPLKELRPLYRKLRKARYRIRKDGNETNQDGSLSANPGRLGPLTMEARRMGLATVLDIQGRINKVAEEQGRPKIDLINEEEQARILFLIENNTWPNKWEGDELPGDTLIANVISAGIIQPLLIPVLERPE